MCKAGRLILMTGLLSLAACSGLVPAAQPTPTPTAPSPTDTPTTVWFPPTDTPSPYPTSTVLPTPIQLPGLGDMIFKDSFDQPAKWNTASSGQASAAVNLGQLILSISGSGPTTINSLRSEPILGDFYADATATPSLCQGNDAYGMIFRAAPGDNYYRFTINCKGQVRLERSRSGSLSPLMDWLLTGDAPLGAPSQVTLGVWVVGSEMRFFLNGSYQFTDNDPVLHQGTLGFFVSASGASPVTVSFSDLSVYSVVYSSPTPTPLPSMTPRLSRTPTP